MIGGTNPFRLSALLFLLLAACAPRVDGVGPTTTTARMEADAFVTADGYRLPYLSAVPSDPRAVLLALHGMNDYSNAFAGSAPIWAEAGIAVYAYDQRGFGRTQGRGIWHGTAALTGDLATVSSLLRARYPGLPLVVLGESMGGAVLLAAQTDPDLPHPDLDRAVLSAPAVWGRALMPWWQRAPLAFFAHTLPWLEIAPRIRRKVSDNIDMLRGLARDPVMIHQTRIDAIYGLVNLMDRAYEGVPDLGKDTLLLFGLQEDILPDAAWKGAVSRLTPGAGWRMAFYDTGYHMLTRDLAGDRVIRDIASFVLTPERPLPSGREWVSDSPLPFAVK
ncbi:alpha/beta hydrolase [Rhodospirillaceae bacterium KN72]|uniref:Alpha/beta hydrolase n=1 Tax=Pacificispira spongiicola TaxID=2729598 RepID=A0A7Y0E170_9PROT|nr:alpha/beta fold hydrolase [Pacificispira spongiicola]NMM45340.1 alpha/beta hydrolase [Pacificispira spongiicola]